MFDPWPLSLWEFKHGVENEFMTKGPTGVQVVVLDVDIIGLVAIIPHNNEIRAILPRHQQSLVVTW